MKFRKNREYVRAQPFAQWLNERFEFYARQDYANFSKATRELCSEVGWPATEGAARKLYRYRHMVYSGSVEKRKGDKRAEWYWRATVEDALHHAGVSIYDLYPELAHERDFPLEPARFCPHCQETVTPINGMCPWDDWSFGRLREMAA